MITILISLFLFQPLPSDSTKVNAQTYRDIKTLSADSMAGRGYSGEGHLRALEYIEDRFRKMGFTIQRQPVTFTINLIESEPQLIIDSDTLSFMYDYLPFPSSASVNISSADFSMSTDTTANGTIIYKLLNSDHKDSDSLILTQKDRLIYSQSVTQSNQPSFYITKPLTNSKYRISAQITTRLDTITSYNLIAYKGDTPYKKTGILTAHYDHLGTVGNHIFNGANDNASGVAGLLYLADIMTQQGLGDDLLFVAFTAEEAGLIGSNYFFQEYSQVWESADFLLNFDMIASGDGSVGVVGGRDFDSLYQQLSNLASDYDIKLRPRSNSPNSDHYWFLANGLPGFYLYTANGKQPYHHIDDDFDTLDFERMDLFLDLSTSFLKRQLNDH